MAANPYFVSASVEPSDAYSEYATPGGQSIPSTPASSEVGASSSRRYSLASAGLELSLALKDDEVSLEAESVDTGSEYKTLLDQAKTASLEAEYIRSPKQLYKFLEQALSVAESTQATVKETPSSVTVGNPLTCSVWLKDDGSEANVHACLEPAFAFQEPMVVSIVLPRVAEATADKKHEIQMLKLTERFEASLKEVVDRFTAKTDALVGGFTAKTDALAEAVDILKVQTGNSITFGGGYVMPMDVETVVVAGKSVKLQPKRITDPSTTSLNGVVATAKVVATAAELDALCPMMYNNNKTSCDLAYDHIQPVFGKIAGDMAMIHQMSAQNVSQNAHELALAQGGLLPNGITSDELRPLKLCTGITHLDLTHANLVHLDFLPALQQLKTLKLNNATGISDLEPLRSLGQLETLDLTGCTKVTDVSLLNDLPKLKSVTLTNTGVVNKMALTNPQLVITGLN